MVSYGFIGTGNMGGALAKALRKKLSDAPIFVSNRSPEKAEALAREICAEVSDNASICEKCDRIVLGVKPQGMADLLQSLKPVLSARKNAPVLISMAAGIKISSINKVIGSSLPVLRIMPNTPVSVGKGVILCSSSNADPAIVSSFLSDFSEAGLCLLIPEDRMDAGCALSGCGPAFVFSFIRSLCAGGIEAGLPDDLALTLAASTVEGAAALLRSASRSPEELIRAVCSPGGSTIEGMKVLEKENTEKSVQAAVLASFEKSKLLGKIAE